MKTNGLLATLDPWTLPRVSMAKVDQLPELMGLYFVFRSSRLLYIGKTRQGFRARWRNHHRTDLLENESLYIAYWELDSDVDIEALELTAIRMFSPQVNGTKAPKISLSYTKIPMPARLERVLTLSSHIAKKQSFPGFIASVLLEECENAWPKVESILDREADQLGIDRDQLEDLVLQKYGFDSTREIEELSQGEK